MRIAGLGEIEDGFTFTEAEIQRASPRFWWGLRKRAAYERILERRGMSRQRDDNDDTDSGSRSDSDRRDGATTGASATAAMSEAFPEKRHESGATSGKSWFGGGSDGGGGSSDGGSSSSSSGGSDGGGGGGGGGSSE